jgi:hypothetical protein
MFSSISNTWTLMGASLDVLKRQKSLLIFPILSTVACLAIIATFILPLVTGDAQFELPNKNSPPEEQVKFYAYWFLFYFCNYFVVIFFNTAIVACAALQFEGRESSVGTGIGAAVSRLPQIIGWALLSATVGIVLRIIEDKSDKIGKFVAGLLGSAWAIVSFLAVPALVLEKKGPFAALSTSFGLLKKTWGEQLSSNFSYGLIFFLLAIPGIAGIVISVMLGQGNPPLLYGGLGLSILYLVTLSTVQSVLQTIFQTALFMYARDGRAPAGFADEMLGSALVKK